MGTEEKINKRDAKLKCYLKAQQRLRAEREGYSMRAKKPPFLTKKHFSVTATSQWYGSIMRLGIFGILEQNF